MPVKVPYNDLPPFPPPPEPVGSPRIESGHLRSWYNEMDLHRIGVQDRMARNFRQLEVLPVSTYHVASTSVACTTSTSGTTMGLDVSLSVPFPGTNLFAQAVLDAHTTNAILVGELWTWAPTASTYSSAATTAQLIFGTAACGDQRGTVTQQWWITDAAPGLWRFQVRIRDASTVAANCRVENHNTLFIEAR